MLTGDTWAATLAVDRVLDALARGRGEPALLAALDQARTAVRRLPRSLTEQAFCRLLQEVDRCRLAGLPWTHDLTRMQQTTAVALSLEHHTNAVDGSPPEPTRENVDSASDHGSSYRVRRGDRRGRGGR